MYFSFEYQNFVLTILSHSLYQFESEINNASVLLDINKLWVVVYELSRQYRVHPEVYQSDLFLIGRSVLDL